MSEPKAESSGAHQASEQYFLLADISGYTAFLANVEHTHGLDFSHGIPAGYDILGALLDVVVQGIQPTFRVAKVEGDAIFGVAAAAELDAVAESLPAALRDVVGRFHEVGLAAGGTDNGSPGIRAQYDANYYAAYVLDPDGNNIEGVCHRAPT